MRLTGSVKAAENYMKYFEKELEIKMHCFKKEEAGVKYGDTIIECTMNLSGIMILYS